MHRLPLMRLNKIGVYTREMPATSTGHFNYSKILYIAKVFRDWIAIM